VTFAQEKYKETFNASDDMMVSLNTSYTNIVFETWNKDKVEVEAYVEDEDLSEEERKRIFDTWDFGVMGNSSQVVITSNTDSQWDGMDEYATRSLLPQMDYLAPIMNEMLIPMMADFSLPTLPKKTEEKIGNVDFDYEAFKKDEKGYLKKFEAQMQEKFGNDFQKDMNQWGEDFAKQWEAKFNSSLKPTMQAKFQIWGKTYGNEMEAWGKSFENDMQKWAEQLGSQFGQGSFNFSQRVIINPNGTKTYIFNSLKSSRPNSGKANKFIIVRMPKGSKTELNVRHGEIKMADVTNIKATLKYSPFMADSVDGQETNISAAYAPVIVNNWKYGTLYVKFVDDVTLANVESINLKANSSDVKIGSLEKEAILSGSFGALQIDNVSKDFKTLDIYLENTDALIKIPNSAFSFKFNGKLSTLQIPKELNATQSKNYDRVTVKGFNKNEIGKGFLTINAGYSNVKLQ